MLTLILSLLSLAFVQPASPPSTPTPPPPTPTAAAGVWADTLKGRWQGAIELPNPPGGTLGFILTINGPDAATIAIPDQGLTATPLAEVAISSAAMKFSLTIPSAPPSASPVFNLNVAADALTAKGTMLQSGMTLIVTIKKLAEGDDGTPPPPPRPQTPKPPFPYTTREVTFGSFDSAIINGTITIPAEATFGKGPHPCALFITGSGIQDRDETIFHHKPFAVIADALARAGVASLRVDDRGFNRAKDPLSGDGTTETFAKDTAAALDFLATQADIDPARTGLIGHSEGGIIAPAVAAARRESKPVAFLVLMAGTGVTGAEVLERQLAAILQSQGEGSATPAQIARALAEQKATLTAVATGDEAAVRAAVTEAIKSSNPSTSSTTPGTTTPSTPAMDAAVEAAVRQAFSPWMRHFVTRDPRTDLRRIPRTCPILILNGGKDVQVVAEQNIPEITKALLGAGHTSFTVRIFPNLNHLFQPVGEKGTGGPDEYAKIETTIDPAALEQIVRWVSETAR